MSSPDYRKKRHKLLIIGSGPAGHTAAIYAARAQLEPVLFEGLMAGGIAAGGQLTTTTDVENYPGFPEGISGPEMMERFRRQSLRFGAHIVTETISKVNFHSRPFCLWPEGAEEEEPVQADALIIATGATAKKIAAKNVEEYWQRGISACAVCDGALPIFRNKVLAVIGGGDSAVEEATFLTKYASKVYLIHRRDQLRASRIMQQRVFAHPKIEILWNYQLEAVWGDGKLLQGLCMKHSQDHTERKLEVGGLFFAIGHQPNTGAFQGQLALDQDAYIIVEAGSCKSSVEGVFAAGDVQDKKYRQAITAAGSGCMAALEAEHWLLSQG